MPNLKNYRLLISHSWKYSNEYEKVVSWLGSSNYFIWSNHSISCDDPYSANSKLELKKKLSNQIRGCNAIVVISGMYASYSEWIDYEIEEAVRMNKPIIGVRPWGSERVPSKIYNNATVMVGWNSDSVVNAIRQYSI